MADTFARYLASGITSVIDVGGPMWTLEAKKLANSLDKAPRLVVAGQLLSPVSPKSLEDVSDRAILAVTSPEHARKIVRQQHYAGADLIKLWVISPGGAKDKNPPSLNKMKLWIEAAIDEAHDLGLKVAAHALDLEIARYAVEAGVDLLAHGVGDKIVDKKFVKLLKKRGTIYTSSLVVIESYLNFFTLNTRLSKEDLEWGNPGTLGSLSDWLHLDNETAEKYSQSSKKNQRLESAIRISKKNLKIIHDAGIPISIGADAFNPGTLHGTSIFREFELLSEAGLSNYEIINSATKGSALFMGAYDTIGSISVGKKADFIILNSDPIADIKNISDIDSVIIKGRSYKREDIIERTSEDVIQHHVNAYNERNINAFMNTLSKEAKLYEWPNTLLFSGHEEIKERFSSRFDSAPDLHAEIVKREIIGNKIIDTERVTGIPGEEVINAKAIYELENKLIKRVLFIPLDHE